MVAGVARQRVRFFFSQGVPTSLQNRSQHRLNLGPKIAAKVVPKGSKIAPWRPLGGLWRPWGALGGPRQVFLRFGGRFGVRFGVPKPIKTESKF